MCKGCNYPANFCRRRNLCGLLKTAGTGIEFQVNLPEKWNDKALQFGGGGTTPTSFPVPDIYKGAQLHSTLRNNAPDTSVTYSINPDGKSYTMLEGTLSCAGSIKWYTDSGSQLLHFYDTAGVNNRLYVVMESTADYLLLHISSGPNPWDWDTWRFDVVHP